MNKFFVTLAFALPLISFGSAFAVEKTVPSIDKLIEGNNRYINSNTVCHEDWSAKRLAKAEGQAPFAVIITCSDSRVPPEIVFDQTLGSLFVVRVAGNIVDDFAIGSIEYGVSVLGADLIVVLGHSNCGAVEGALKGMKFDNHIQEVLNAIQPAVQASKNEKGDALENAIRANVKYVEAKLSKSRPVLANLLGQGKVTIVGGYYDLASGKVDFFETISK